MNSAGIRTMRVFRVVLLVYAAALVTLEMLAHGYVPVFTLVVLAFMLSVVGLHTHVIRRQRRIDAIKNRPRPDYPAIAAMEQEIWGETFAHEGAPERRQRETGADVAALHAQMDDLAEQATIRRLAACWHCGTVPTLVNGLCPECYRILKGWGIQAQRPACPQGHPDRRWVEGCGEVCPTCDDARNARSNLRWN